MEGREVNFASPYFAYPLGHPHNQKFGTACPLDSAEEGKPFVEHLSRERPLLATYNRIEGLGHDPPYLHRLRRLQPYSPDSK